jgi:hypothetical protein
MTRALDVVADGAMKSNAMLADAYDTIRSKGDSTSDTLKIALELAEKFNGGGKGNDEELRQLRVELEKSRDKQFEMLMEMVREAKEGKTSANPAQSPFSYAKDGITAFKEMRQFIDELNPKPTVAEEAAEAAGVPSWLIKVLEVGLPVVGQLAQAFMYRNGPPPPMPQQTAPQPIPNPMQPVQPYPGGGGTGYPAQPMPSAQPTPPNNVMQMPPPQGIGAATTPSGVPTFGLPPDVAELLFEIKTVMCEYLVAREPGDAYADLFLANYGQDIFTMVRSFGVEGLMGAIMAFPPITSRLQTLAISPDRLKAFVTEFMGYDPKGDGNDGNGDTAVDPTSPGGAA